MTGESAFEKRSLLKKKTTVNNFWLRILVQNVLSISKIVYAWQTCQLVLLNINIYCHWGIIDSDFFPHEIKVALRNTTDQPVKLLKNERCAQGIFLKYLVSDNGNLDNTRDGGIGSTKK